MRNTYQVFDNGNKFHLIHSGMIALAPLTRRPHLVLLPDANLFAPGVFAPGVEHRLVVH
jgi:hypothetical protein